MNTKTSIHFIINAISGKGNNRLNKNLIDTVFNPVKYHIVLKKSKFSSDIVNHTTESLKEGPSIIVACGGDGTINEIGSLLVGTPTKLGIIPFGSGNGLARSLNIPNQVFYALKAIKSGYTKKIDVGLINQYSFFCNAKGSGRANIIICSYNPLIWDEEIILTKTFYTSGLGGIFPKNIEVGNVINISDISPNLREVEIALSANPLDDDIFGVFKN